MAAVFVTAGVLFGAVGGATLVTYRTLVTRIVGVLAITMGLVFAGLLPIGGRELRLSRLPTAGLGRRFALSEDSGRVPPPPPTSAASRWGPTMVVAGLLLVTGGWDLITGAVRQGATVLT